MTSLTLAIFVLIAASVLIGSIICLVAALFFAGRKYPAARKTYLLLAAGGFGILAIASLFIGASEIRNPLLPTLGPERAMLRPTPAQAIDTSPPKLQSSTTKPDVDALVKENRRRLNELAPAPAEASAGSQ